MRFPRRSFLVLLGLAALLAPLACLHAADTPPPPTKLRPITPEDLWSVRRAAGLDLSPDGSRLVFTVQDYNLEKNNSLTHLWLLDTAPGHSTRCAPPPRHSTCS